MTLQDKLPVLPFPAPQHRHRKPATPVPHDKLAQAVAALRAADMADVQAPTYQPKPQTDDSFTPVGAPRWRARLPLDAQAQTRAQTGAQEQAGRVGAAAGAVTRQGTTSPMPAEKDPLTRRITVIHLPHFAMERWQRWAATQPDAAPETLPTALAIEGTHGPTVYATNHAARACGVQTGARVVDMRALCPDLKITYADVAGDQAHLQKLMLWVRRWCPWTATDGPAGLVLDTTGSDHLWGGEAAMLRDIEERLSYLGFSANLAVSPTHGASWALSRYGGVRAICPPDTLAQHVAPLPVRALRLDGATVQLLTRLGLKTIGDLAAVPRISLARRFSRAALHANPVLRLDQLMGRLHEPLNATDDPPRFAVQANLAEPIQDPTPHLPALCADLCHGLAHAGFGARRICVTVYRSDGDVSAVEVATAQPSRDPDHICRLFADKLDRINPGFGFDLITLGATVAEKLGTVQTRLDGQSGDGAEVAKLLDRLSARLGAGSVRRPVPHASHIPERAECWDTALTGPPRQAAPRPNRPLRMFDHPEEVRVLYQVPEGPPAQFVWRRVTLRVVRFAGPERVAPEWWRDMPGTRLRDYYTVEDQHARRIWMFREGVLGDGRDHGQANMPRWFVHGVFP